MEGTKSLGSQLAAMKILTKQIEVASKENKQMIIMGDANLCSRKWKDQDFKYRKTADELLDILTQCGITPVEIGDKYM